MNSIIIVLWTACKVSPGFAGIHLDFPGISRHSPVLSPHFLGFYHMWRGLLCCLLRCIARECSKTHVPWPHTSNLSKCFEQPLWTIGTVNQTLEDMGTEVGEMQETMDQHGVDISKLEATKDELQTKVKLHCTVLKQKCWSSQNFTSRKYAATCRWWVWRT